LGTTNSSPGLSVTGSRDGKVFPEC
jgi:hypothetical protein